MKKFKNEIQDISNKLSELESKEEANKDSHLKLKEIGKLTFAETFSSENSEENMKEYLESGFSTEKLTAELTDSNAEFYLYI